MVDIEAEKSKIESQTARTRLLVAAEQLFAAQGLAATSIRELARTAGVNVAAVNYYFGSKDNLYLETLRKAFQQTGVTPNHFEAIYKQAQTEITPARARQAIKEFIKLFMQTLFASEESQRHACLMAREISDPSPALDVIIAEFILPKHKTLMALLEQAQPKLVGKKELPWYALSIVGQCLHYHFTLPITLRLLQKKQMTPELLSQISAHIADFSLQALANIATE